MSEHLTNIVVVGFIVRNGKIFIAKRAPTKTAFPGQYELVGGHLDPGETLEEGLRREIEEELKVSVSVDTLVDAFTYTSEEVFKVELCYLCYLDGPTMEPVLNPADHSESLWITEEEISKSGKDDREVKALQQAFKRIKEKSNE